MLKQLAHPFSLLLVGKSGVGKTYLTARLLHHVHSIISPLPKCIIYCYGIWQLAYDEIKARDSSVQFIKGIPDNLEEENFLNSYQPNLLILDDVIKEANSNNQIGSLFLIGSHHRNLSVILISQNLFHQEKQSRTQNVKFDSLLQSTSWCKHVERTRSTFQFTCRR